MTRQRSLHVSHSPARTQMAHRLFTCLALLVALLTSQLALAVVHKSPADSRDYLAFTLPNQMKVLVISDPDTDKAAASLDVGVGSNANPEERAGLAHFLEHMLFLGTEKYPEAGEYQAFISSHGGSHNAYTAFENTNYFFDIRADDLEPALDRFAQFFISPLFTEAYVDRERHAVHSEYQSKLRDDGRRIYSVSRQQLNPAHSYSHFQVGSLDTLADRENDPVREDLIRFYEQYYSANLMTLVVLGREPVETLQAMVEQRFAAVPDRDARPFTNSAPLFTKGSLPRSLTIKTIKDLRYLSLSFPLPEVRTHWREKPLYYISSLVGYEGKGSLLALLKQKGWATALAASNSTDLPDVATFDVDIELTPEGIANRDAIVALFFQYIRLIRQDGVQASLYDEERNLTEIHFRFQERGEPMHYVSGLSRQLQEYPMEEVIRAPYLLTAFNPGLIDNLLGAINPDNMILTLKAQDVETAQIDPWYQTEFGSRALSEHELTAFRSDQTDPALFIRSANPYIARQFEIKGAEPGSTLPVTLERRNGLTLWHHQDSSFQTPKANFYFSVISRRSNSTPRDAVLTSLYTRMVKDHLNETLYDAQIAGLNTEIYPHIKGFSVRLSGYDDKLPALLEPVVTALSTPVFSAERFAIIRQQYAEQLANARKDKPFNQTISEIFQLLLPQWSQQQREQALAEVTLSDLEAFVPELLAETELRILSHGNLLQDESRALAATVASRLQGKTSTALNQQTPVVRLEKGQELTQTLDLTHNDSAISVYFQGGDNSLATRAEYAVLSELLASPFYNRLRTEQQLGYVVFETPLSLQRAPGLAFVVQSPVADPVTLEQHINTFLNGMDSEVAKLTDSELERYKHSVISRVLKDENSLNERTNRYWSEIDVNNADFQSREALATSIAAVSLERIRSSLDQLSERRLTVRSFGSAHLTSGNNEEVLKRCDTEIEMLKQRGAFFPEA